MNIFNTGRYFLDKISSLGVAVDKRRKEELRRARISLCLLVSLPPPSQEITLLSTNFDPYLTLTTRFSCPAADSTIATVARENNTLSSRVSESTIKVRDGQGWINHISKHLSRDR